MSHPSSGSSETVAVGYADLESAARRLDGVADRTPVLTARSLDARVSASAYLKCEQFQRTGAFKFRGAYNALSRLPEEQQHRGVMTYSSGNHAQAIALAGRLLEIPTTIVMPETAPTVKLEATRGYGAEIVLYDPETTVREEFAQTVSEERGLPIIPPSNHPHVVAGQGTAGKELIEEVGELDVIAAGCGGGGLLSGCAIAADRLAPDARVVGVEPVAGDDATRSFYTGELQTVTDPDTIADGARTPSLGDVTFPIIRSFVDEMVTVSDRALVETMRFLWERMKLIVEPTGALALAALLDGAFDAEGESVGCLISGGNVDVETACALFARYDSAS